LPAVPLLLCVLLSATPGNARGLAFYEDEVLSLLPAHGARVVQRLRMTNPAEGMCEVHVLEFPSRAALDAYLADPARVALADVRDRVVADTQVFPVEDVTG
jgi:uncharacterized protein (DUF1330 family)